MDIQGQATLPLEPDDAIWLARHRAARDRDTARLKAENDALKARTA